MLTANSITFNNVVAQPITASTPFEQLAQGRQQQPQQQQQTAAETLATTKPGTILLTTFPNGTSKAQYANGTTVQVLNGVGYLVLDPSASAASASASAPVSNTVVNRFYQAIAIAIGITINATDHAPPQPNTTQSGGPDQDCLFDPSLSKCTPGPEGCPEGFGTNENGQCFPLGGCPDGYHSVEDDESGTCYPDSTPCPDGQVRSDEGNFCLVPKLGSIAPLDCGPGFALNPTTEQCEAVESTPVEPEPEPEPDNGGNDDASGGDGSDDGDNGGGDA